MESTLRRLEYIQYRLNNINKAEDDYDKMCQLYFAYVELKNIFGAPSNFTEEIKQFGRELLDNIINIINRSPKGNELIFIPHILRGYLETRFEGMYDTDENARLMGHELDNLVEVAKYTTLILEEYLYDVKDENSYTHLIRSLAYKADPVTADDLVKEYVRYVLLNIITRLEEEKLLDPNKTSEFKGSIIDTMRTMGVYRKEPLSKEELEKKITRFVIGRTAELVRIREEGKLIENTVNNFETLLNECKIYSYGDDLMLDSAKIIKNIDELQKSLSKIKEAINGGKENGIN